MLKYVMGRKEEVMRKYGLGEMEYRGLLKVERGERGAREMAELLYGEKRRGEELMKVLEELRDLDRKWEREEVEEKRGEEEEGYEAMSREEIEIALSRMGRGEAGLSGKDQLQALSLYIRMKGWGQREEEEVGELSEELVKMMKG